MMLYEKFLEIAKTLNNDLDITPLLYGSLGLEKASGITQSTGYRHTCTT